MSWTTYSVGDLCEVFDGPHATPSPSLDGPIYLGITSIRQDGTIDFENSKRISYEDYPKWTKRVTPQEDDVVFSYEANLDSFAIIPEGFEGCLGRRMAIMRPNKEKIEPRFLYYYLLSPKWKAVISQKTVLGATVNRIPIATYPSFPIDIPCLEEQRRIAGILSAYDSLIENNRKQIKLLEEAAQRLYKEWFIDLRFPGHESVEIDPDTGLPEGWKESAFLDEVSFVRGKSYNADNLVDASEQQLINLSNIAPFGGWLPGGEKPYSGNCRADQIVSSGDILLAVTDMTKERRLVGHAAMVPRSLSGSVISMDLIKLNPNNIAPMYLYCLLRFSGVASMISMLANGTNVLHLKPESMNRVRILVPNLDVQGKFSQLVKPLFASIDCLSEQITIASEARNRLLPELLGGTDD